MMDKKTIVVLSIILTPLIIITTTTTTSLVFAGKDEEEEDEKVKKLIEEQEEKEKEFLAQKFTNYDGTQITQSEYMTRVSYCAEMVVEGELPMSIKCRDWVLTEEGNVELALYGFKKYELN